MDLNSPETLASFVSQLVSVIATEVQEDGVNNEIKSRLKVLRDAYKRNKKIFSTEQIQWLQDVRDKGHAIALFIELKEEIELATNIDDYQDLLSRLFQLRHVLQGAGVALRIDKEIRSLRERFPDMMQNEANAKETRQFAVINALDRDSPLCPREHKMLIRSGPTGFFWGCSEYPNHVYSRQLSHEQQERIDNA